MNKIVYFDNNATTRVAPEVRDVMLPFLGDLYGNPSSMHAFGGQIAKFVDRAREEVARFINADPEEIVFTSCATESDNTAIRGTADYYGKDLKVITTAVEHPAILQPVRRLKALGYETVELPVNEVGQIDLGQLEKEIVGWLGDAAGETHTALATAFGSSASPRQICGTGDLAEAAKMLQKAAFTNFARRSTRRGNDFQVAIFALEELNGLLAWCATNHVTIEIPQFDAAYRRDLPVGLRIVLAWDADETDIDLHVLEPNGEEAYYGHRRTAEGGFVSEDVTTGYGPEEYLAKDLQRGVYKVLTNYFASHQTTLTGATTVQATVYTNWGSANEKMQILTLRLDKPKDKVLIGEIAL